MTKEMEVGPGEDLFGMTFSEIKARGAASAIKMLQLSGGLSGIYQSLPLDRGQVNQSLVMLCLTASAEIETDNPIAAKELRSIASQIGLSTTEAGGKSHNTGIVSLLDTIKKSLRATSAAERIALIGPQQPFITALSTAITNIRVLVAGGDVLVDDRIDSSGEIKQITEAIRRSKSGSKMLVDHIVGFTFQELNQKLLDAEYSILHFSGHGDTGLISIRNDSGGNQMITVDSIRDFLKNHKTIKSVFFNSCKTLDGIEMPIAPCTIGMTSSISDDVALKFSGFFYDSIGAGKSFGDAYQLSVDGTNALFPGGVFKSKLLGG